MLYQGIDVCELTRVLYTSKVWNLIKGLLTATKLSARPDSPTQLEVGNVSARPDSPTQLEVGNVSARPDSPTQLEVGNVSARPDSPTQLEVGNVSGLLLDQHLGQFD